MSRSIKVVVSEKETRTYEFPEDYFGTGFEITPATIRDKFLNNPEIEHEEHKIDEDTHYYNAEAIIHLDEVVEVGLDEIIDLNREQFFELLANILGVGVLAAEEYEVIGNHPEKKNILLIRVKAEIVE